MRGALFTLLALGLVWPAWMLAGIGIAWLGLWQLDLLLRTLFVFLALGILGRLLGESHG
jgi:hypothetical protein